MSVCPGDLNRVVAHELRIRKLGGTINIRRQNGQRQRASFRLLLRLALRAARCTGTSLAKISQWKLAHLPVGPLHLQPFATIQMQIDRAKLLSGNRLPQGQLNKLLLGHRLLTVGNRVVLVHSMIHLRIACYSSPSYDSETASKVPTMEIKAAAAVDIPAISEIYNHYVRNATCTFATEPEGPAYWDAWLAEHGGPFPALVATDAGRVVGWATLSRWNNRCAYRFSTEDSVYIRPECHRQGIGRALLAALVDLARRHGHRNIIAQIADHQTASEKLHAALGFRLVGCLERIGYKFDRWIDVAIWQLRLDTDAQSPMPTPAPHDD